MPFKKNLFQNWGIGKIVAVTEISATSVVYKIWTEPGRSLAGKEMSNFSFAFFNAEMACAENGIQVVAGVTVGKAVSHSRQINDIRFASLRSDVGSSTALALAAHNR